jgi:hypothetical protein
MMQDKLMCVVLVCDDGEIEGEGGLWRQGLGRATGVILQGRFGSWLSEAWDPGRWEETLGFAGARLRENRRACRSSDVAGEDFRLSAGFRAAR